MTPLRRQARSAGLVYTLACITAPFSLFYVPSALMVPGNAAATAERVRASGLLLRMGIASELLCSVLLVFAVLAFYRLFHPAGERLARAMAALILVSIPVSLFNVTHHLVTLTLAGTPPFLAAFEPRQLDALAYLFLRLHAQGTFVASIFWGLWLFPLGVLVMRSGFIPRWAAYGLFAAGSGYLLSAFASLFVPQYSRFVSPFAMVLALGEFPLIVWLLGWGAREQPGSPAVEPAAPAC